jgi:hypothetical protein
MGSHCLDAAGQSLFGNPYVDKMDGAIGHSRIARIVRDHADGRALPVQLLQEIHHHFAILRIEISRGLIREHDRWLASQRARYRYALLLAAGKLGGVMFHPMRHAHAVQRFPNALSAFTHAHVAIREWQLDIFKHGEVTYQIKCLENKANLAVTNAAAF